MNNRYYFSDLEWRTAGGFIKAGLTGIKAKRYGYDGSKLENYVEFDHTQDYNKFIKLINQEKNSSSFISPRTTWLLQWEMEGKLNPDGREMFVDLLGLANT